MAVLAGGGRVKEEEGVMLRIARQHNQKWAGNGGGGKAEGEASGEMAYYKAQKEIGRQTAAKQ
jgi:hypothetical protein